MSDFTHTEEQSVGGWGGGPKVLFMRQRHERKLEIRVLGVGRELEPNKVNATHTHIFFIICIERLISVAYR